MGLIYLQIVICELTRCDGGTLCDRATVQRLSCRFIRLIIEAKKSFTFDELIDLHQKFFDLGSKSSIENNQRLPNFH